MGTAKQSRALGENKVLTFDLTSTLDPTDEQLQALMEGIGEIGRRSSARKKEIIDRMLKEALQ